MGWGWALIRGWALINFFHIKDGRLFEVGANSRLGAYSNKYGIGKYFLIIGKNFLYVKALNGKFYIFNEFVSLAHDKISLEKYISCTTFVYIIKRTLHGGLKI